MTTQARDPLKPINGTAPSVSKLKQPTKVAVPVESENAPTAMDTSMLDTSVDQSNSLSQTLDSRGIKRKKTEAELREELRQRKMMNTTLTTSELTSTAKAKKPATTTSRTDLNRTMDSARLRSTMSTSKPSTVSRPTASSARGTTARGTTSSTATTKSTKDVYESRLLAAEGEVAKMKIFMDEFQAMKAQLMEKESQVVQISEIKRNLEGTVDNSKQELQKVYLEKMDLQNQMVALQNEHNSKLQDLMIKHNALETTFRMTTSQLNLSKSENENLKLNIQSQLSQISAINAELDATKTALQQALAQSAERQRKIENMQIVIDERDATIKNLESLRREDENVRKKLHNTILELKGNIRVFCRVRPFIGAEGDECKNESCFDFPSNSDKSLEIVTNHLSAVSGKPDGSKKYEFSFDKVFQPNSAQGQIFEEISQLVQSALDGYNTCIFAYGQTGSGKTYTMEGPGIQSEIDMPIVDQEKRGMIPRAVEQIFVTAESLKEKGWSYEMEAMFVEIYNETIRDLLTTKKNDDQKYEIKHDAKGNTSITNANYVKVRSPTQVYTLLARAASNRSVGSTKMNDRSSRSHSVFQLTLNGTNTITGEKCRGILNLVDLAGSERLEQSQVQGERLKETLAINKSLSHLGDVIAALASKDAHIPYRNSKLTYLLQNCLGGNSKTLMFVNVSPRFSDLNETISSLRFATKVNACEIGTAKKQVKVDLK